MSTALGYVYHSMFEVLELYSHEPTQSVSSREAIDLMPVSSQKSKASCQLVPAGYSVIESHVCDEEKYMYIM